MEIIKIDNLQKKYNDFIAVDDVSFSVQKGEIVSILGPNGAGKTTLIKMMTGYLSPSSGSITYKTPQQFGVVFGGDLGFYNNMSAYDNLLFFARLKKIKRKELSKEVTNALEEVSLVKYKDDRVSTFSKGMKQRLHIARALLGNPSILFLDEPTVGLDIERAHEIRVLINKLKDKGVTIILTTHILTDIEFLTNKVILLNNGKIQYEGTLPKLISQAQKNTNKPIKTTEEAYLALIRETNELS